MANCVICKENLGLMDKKRLMHDENGKVIVYCNNCYSDWENKKTEKERIKNEEDKKNKLKKVLQVNPKWEYLVKKIETAFGGSVKVGDNELYELGEEGWELVGVTAVNQSNFIAGQIVTLIMAFKRRMP